MALIIDNKKRFIFELLCMGMVPELFSYGFDSVYGCDGFVVEFGYLAVGVVWCETSHFAEVEHVDDLICGFCLCSEGTYLFSNVVAHKL